MTKALKKSLKLSVVKCQMQFKNVNAATDFEFRDGIPFHSKN